MSDIRASRRRTRLGLFLAGTLLGALPGAALGQTLEDALSAAYLNNPRLLGGQAELRATNEAVPQAQSGWRPRVELSASAGLNRQSVDAGRGWDPETRRQRSAELGVVQPLYRGGRTEAGVARAENQVFGQRAVLVDTEQAVLLDAVIAYMDVWRDEAEVRLNINSEQVISRQLAAARDRFEVGETTRTDVAQAESRLSRATAQRIAAEGQLRSSRAIFREVTGIPVGTLEAPEPVRELPASEFEAAEQAQLANPQVVAAGFFERAAERAIRERYGELLPEVNLRAGASEGRDMQGRGVKTSSLSLIAEVTVPIYQQGLVSSQVREAKQTTSQRRLEMEQARRAVEQEAISAWEALASARAQIVSFDAEIQAAEIALEGVREEATVGARTVLDVLDQEQELLDAQVNRVRAQRDEVVASFRLLAAVGRLTAGDLGLDVPLYDPELDYRAVRDRWYGLSVPNE
ncbi:TolC family outer membrane protein [Aquibaculum arenosum]|uniref:TolC family outer membrane protein n=1 Tax=Aquibaculum arenosum TaxID=3032591 RepID=A0ABT5YNZ6_9PROT|nr:TolC family outer membrane protein [Fodinicurvata sp. CAU 1616]MDF2096691.1 TolC family outer membrane protein [Fodinicurvata sp. CAU 1616]